MSYNKLYFGGLITLVLFAGVDFDSHPSLKFDALPHSAIPKHTFWPISPKPVELQTSNLYQIVALNVLVKKGHWVHGAKFDSLGAGSQNVNLPAKTLKIAVFRPGPPQDVKNFHFFCQKL